jgi:hypothetical protein
LLVMLVRSVKNLSASAFMVSICSTPFEGFEYRGNLLRGAQLNRKSGRFLVAPRGFFSAHLQLAFRSISAHLATLRGINFWGLGLRGLGLLVCVGEFVLGLGGWPALRFRVGFSAGRRLVFFSLFRLSLLGFFFPYGCALARARHARAHNSGTTGTTYEYGHIGRIFRRARGTYIVVTCTYLRTHDFPY